MSETTQRSIRTLRKSFIRVLGIIPVRWLLSEHFPAEENLRDSHGPIAVLVGGRDPVVPERFGLRVYERYSGSKRLWKFPNLDHDLLMEQPPEIWKEIITFWEEHR
jgi:pimeloyl-ACP methyl ester carboxylesterase